jgi:hypothetical protein
MKWRAIIYKGDGNSYIKTCKANTLSEADNIFRELDGFTGYRSKPTEVVLNVIGHITMVDIRSKWNLN